MTDAVTNAVALKPCPFCGSAARLTISKPSNLETVACDNDYCVATGPLARSNQSAAEAWNTRALSPAPVERREAIAEQHEMAIANAMNDALNAMVDAKEEMTTTRITARLLGDKAVRASILALPCADEALIRADEREKQKEIDAKIAEHNDRWDEWSKFVVRQQMVPVTAMQTAIAHAIRNGGAK